MLAALALDQAEPVAAAAISDQAEADVAAAIEAVLPAGVADADPRRVALLARVSRATSPPAARAFPNRR